MKKLSIFVLAGLGIILISGCGQGQPNKSQSTDSSDIIQSSSKSPTSQANSNQTTINNPDWKNYANNEFGFELKYPTGWEVRNSRFPSVKGVEIALPDNPGISIGIAYYESLSEMRLAPASLDDYMKSPGLVNPVKGKFKGDDSVTATINHKGSATSEFSESVLVVQHSGHVYVMNYINDENYSEIMKQIVETLSFIK